MRKGFTLIEVLVVIAIIGILATLMVPSSNGALSTAKETTCRNNLRNLWNAAINHANDRGESSGDVNYLWNDGVLPRAGSHEVRDSRGIYHERRGWISWVDSGLKGYKTGQDKPQIDSMEDGWALGADFDAKRAYFAVTNGTLWEYVSQEPGVYVCPVAVKSAGFKEFGKTKGFTTYMMNEFFFYEGNKQRDWYHSRLLSAIGTSAEKIGKNMDSSDDYQNFSPEASNLLLFAEQSGESWNDDYKIGKNCVMHVPNGSADGSKASHIGLYHGRKKNDLRGLGVFLDGHIAAIPSTTPGANPKNTLFWLCRGEIPEAK